MVPRYDEPYAPRGTDFDRSAASKLLKCSWDNNDDTDATALITVNEGTGVVRVLLAWAGG